MLTSLVQLAANWLSVNPATVVCIAVTLALLFANFLTRRLGQLMPVEVPNGLILPPCLPWIPVFGSAPFMFKSFDDLIGSNLMKTLPEFFLQKCKKLGNVIAFYSMSRYTIVLNGRRTIHDALVKKAVAFADRKPTAAEQLIANPRLNGIVSCPFGKGLSKRRNVTLSLLRDLGYGKSAMEFHIHNQMVRFIKDAGEFKGNSFDPAPLAYQFVAGLIFAVLFGRPFEITDPLVEHAKLFADTWFSINAAMYDIVPLMRLLPQFRKLRKSMIASSEKLFELLRQEVHRCLSNEREDSFTFKYAKKEGRDSAYSEDFMFIVRDLLLGGTDTTQHTMRWLLKMLANHGNIQRSLQATVDDFYGKSQRLPSIDDVSKLPLVAATLLETMRVETLGPLAVPHQTLCDTDVDGYHIPKGTMVVVNLYSGHMDPDDWDSPLDFRPDRFIDSDGKLVNHERIIAFSLGKRACIGEQLARAELFIFLASLLRNFHVLPPEGQLSVVTERVCELAVQPSSFDIRMIRRNDARDNASTD